MATFEEVIESYTGFNIGGSPNEDETNNILTTGVRDVVDRILAARPEEAHRFSATTQSSSNDYVAKVGPIISVLREHDSTTILRPCTPMDPADRYEASDKDSLKYRSKYNPGWYELDGEIHSRPQASATDDNELTVTQVTYDTAVTKGQTVGSGIDNMPTEYEYLVALYAAMKIALHKMGAMTQYDPVTTVPPVAPVLTDSTVSFSTSPPSYDNTIANTEFSELSTIVDTNEDVELAAVKVQEISVIIQNQLNEFNEANVEYQAQLQLALNNAQLESGDDSQKIQTYQAEVADYQAQVAADIQNSQAKYQWYQDIHSRLAAEYAASFGTPPRREEQ